MGGILIIKAKLLFRENFAHIRDVANCVGPLIKWGIETIIYTINLN